MAKVYTLTLTSCFSFSLQMTTFELRENMLLSVYCHHVSPESSYFTGSEIILNKWLKAFETKLLATICTQMFH